MEVMTQCEMDNSNCNHCFRKWFVQELVTIKNRIDVLQSGVQSFKNDKSKITIQSEEFLNEQRNYFMRVEANGSQIKELETKIGMLNDQFQNPITEALTSFAALKEEVSKQKELLGILMDSTKKTEQDILTRMFNIENKNNNTSINSHLQSIQQSVNLLSGRLADIDKLKEKSLLLDRDIKNNSSILSNIKEEITRIKNDMLVLKTNDEDLQSKFKTIEALSKSVNTIEVKLNKLQDDLLNKIDSSQAKLLEDTNETLVTQSNLDNKIAALENRIIQNIDNKHVALIATVNSLETGLRTLNDDLSKTRDKLGVTI
jgi:DNA repair exonuclease SbcCD ATPase subunit